MSLPRSTASFQPSTDASPKWPAWEHAEKNDHQSKKIAWRLFRQFRSPDEILREFQVQPEFQWSVRERSDDVGATKLLLHSSTSRQSCEAVALFPAFKSKAGEKQALRLPRATACISSQPGCGVGCPFCATGELGYRGNLSSAEIAEQVYWTGLIAQQAGRRLRNVVFMGMGEPLHNTQAVIDALQLLTSPALFGLPARRITVSTAGVPAAMLRLVREFPDVRIALSLHAAEPELRRQLVPRAFADLQVLQNTLREINALQPKHPVWIEIVLFELLNDSPSHAQLLVAFCAGLRVEVNVIPYNTAANAGQYIASSRPRREAFANVLRAAGIRATIRNSLGQNNSAACGQLSAKLTCHEV
jgi:adenine C2-methylase RlmN of 23S rRNA A2503 and tRNA A37